MPDDRTSPSPFHAGEQAIQDRLGVRDRIEPLGRRVIRDHMPDQHRAFFAQLPWLIIGAVDAGGRPWASVLTGAPGFLQAPDPRLLSVRAQPVPGDPLGPALTEGTAIGGLGIEPHTRRRNRINGTITARRADSFDIRVDQSFGNCPQYIQARQYGPAAGRPGPRPAPRRAVACGRLFFCFPGWCLRVSRSGRAMPIR